MNLSLPQLKKTTGFTLIELMVTIAIIAVITVVGVTLYTNVQKSARDSKRTAELEAIANALEVNKGVSSYIALTAAMFGGGNFPGGDTVQAKDPSGFAYCINSTTSATVPGDANPSNFAPPITCSGVGGIANYLLINGLNPVTASNHITWKICTQREIATPLIFCRTNLQ